MITKPEETFDLTIYQTLRREVQVLTNDYELDGEVFDISNTDWDNVMLKNRYYTPYELLLIFRIYLENHKGPQYLIDECNSYLVDDTNYEAC